MYCSYICVKLVCLIVLVSVFPRADENREVLVSHHKTGSFIGGEKKDPQRGSSPKQNNPEGSAGEKGRKEGRESEIKTRNREKGMEEKDVRTTGKRSTERGCVSVCECAYWKGWVSGKRNNENAQSLHPFHSDLLFCCSYFLYLFFLMSFLLIKSFIHASKFGFLPSHFSEWGLVCVNQSCIECLNGNSSVLLLRATQFTWDSRDDANQGCSIQDTGDLGGVTFYFGWINDQSLHELIS